MIKQELLDNIIMKNISVFPFIGMTQEEDKDKFYKYLIGEITDYKEIKLESLVISYQFANYLITQVLKKYFREEIKSKEKEKEKKEIEPILSRLFFLFEKNPEELFEKFKLIPNRYFYYKKFKISEITILYDLQESARNTLKHVSCPSNHKEQIKLEFLIKRAEFFYPNIMKKIYFQWRKERKNKKDYSGIFLLIFSKIHQIHKIDEINIELCEMAEQIFGILLKQKFGEKEIKEVLKQFGISNPFECFCKKYTKNIELIEEDCNKLLLAACNFCLDVSTRLNIYIKSYYFLNDVKKIYYHLKEQKQNFYFEWIIERFHFPSYFSFSYYFTGFLDTSISRLKQNFYLQEINSLLIKEKSNIFTILDTFIEKKDIFVCLFLAFLLKEEKLSKIQKQKYCVQAEQILFDYFIQEKKYLKEKERKDSNKKEQSFNFIDLKEKDLSMDELYLKFSYFYNIDFQTLFSCTLSLLDNSILARNLLKLILLNWSYWNSNKFLMEQYQIFHKKKEINFYENLYKMGISPFYLISAALTEETTEEIKELLKFLEVHKQEVRRDLTTFSFEKNIEKKYICLLCEHIKQFDFEYLEPILEKAEKASAEAMIPFLLSEEKRARTWVENYLLNSDNKQCVKIAERLLKQWDNQKIQEQLKEIKDLETLTIYINQQYTKKNEKYAPYSNKINYSAIRYLDSDILLPEHLIKYYISEYMLQKEFYINYICTKIEEFMNVVDSRILIQEIFELWIEDNYRPSYKNIILLLSITAKEAKVTELKNRIDFFMKQRRPSLAVLTVRTLKMNHTKLAFLLLERLSKTHRNYKIRNAAAETIQEIIEEKDLTKEEFDDFIVPNLGFDKEGKKIYDYGERKFTAILTITQQIILYNEKGEKIKILPRYSKKYNDIESCVILCKEEQRELRKQIKLVLEEQEKRLLQALILKRSWRVLNWIELFLKNPIMKGFANTLIWREEKKNGKLLGVFRYLEDGSFTTFEEKEYYLSENTYISLAHPSEFEEKEYTMWRNQLKDYEIKQPIIQMDFPIYCLKKKQATKTALYIFQNQPVYGNVLKYNAKNLGFYSIHDYVDYHYMCTGYKYIDSQNGIKIKVSTNPFYESVHHVITKFIKITFSKKILKESEEEKITQMNNQEDEYIKPLLLEQVPDRLLSLAVYFCMQALKK